MPWLEIELFFNPYTRRSPSIRQVKARDVNASLRSTGRYRSDQSAIWQEVAGLASRRGAVSESMDMDLVFDKEAPVIKEYLEGFALVDRQVGAVFMVNGKVVGMDAFGKVGTFSWVFKNLLESYSMDAVDRFEKESDAGDGKKVASGVLAAALAARAESRPSVGLGMDLRLESEKLVGFALEHEDRVVHIFLFPNAGNRKADSPNRMVRHSTRRQRSELPLAEALEGSDEAEYGLFERFFHRDSFIADLSGEASAKAQEAEDTEEKGRDKSAGIYKCRLDHDRDQSEQALEQYVKAPFLAQVDEVLQYICNGFIFDTQKSGEEYTEEERTEIFESAVKLIYRCLFLFYAEARRLLPTDPEKADLYHRHSIKELCIKAHNFRWGQRRDTDQYDLWKHLKGLINAVNDGDPEYGIMGYNGGLFDDEEERFLGQHQLRNDFLSRALYLLAFVEPFDNEPDGEYPIPYKDLEVRHLGELYENILEYTVLLADADRIRRRTKKGVEIFLASQTTKKTGDTLIKKGDVYFGESALERKQTGSYYTPEPLVRFLNQKTIVKPLYEAFERKYQKRFNELLEQIKGGHDTGTRRGAAQSAAALVERFADEEVFHFKVCDPAMGSGHFLVDAANQMAGLVVALLAEVPHVEGMTVSVTSRPNDWRRRITRHCIYGVDLNPLAVNLAKLSLWLNCFATPHRLTFLDHHVRCGNSLIGIRSLSQLSTIPERKKEGPKKKSQQRLLFDYHDLSGALGEAANGVASITRIDEDDTDTQKALLDETGGHL